jgi:3-hydroxybutyryl-CoA dehydrogenase
VSELPQLPPPVVVIGAGTMGRGIAIACVTAGLPTTVVDVDAAVLAAAAGAATTSIRKRNPEIDVDALLSTSDDLERAVKGAGAVIEAVPEILPLKLEIFERLGRCADDDALLASNTSTMSVTRLAGACARPERVVGMHFFNPAHRMPLVEVIHGTLTAWPAVEDAVALARRIGKEPVVVRDVPGFVTSRLGLLLGNEAMRLVQEGVASADDVDKAMRLGYRHPMGPLELADLVGLDARLNNVRSMFEQVGNEQYRPPAILERLVADGHLGCKSGRGFYLYGEDGTKVGPAPDVSA